MAALNYYSYDAATGVCSQQQTQAQFHDSLTADLERAMSAFLSQKPAPQHGLAAFLDVSGGLQAPPKPAGKKTKR